MRAIHLKVNGIVQGVFFRKSTLDFVESNCNNIRGYVRNLNDGSVEVLANGPEGEIKKLVDYCQHGPEMASVINVEELALPKNVNNLQKFHIKY